MCVYAAVKLVQHRAYLYETGRDVLMTAHEYLFPRPADTTPARSPVYMSDETRDAIQQANAVVAADDEPNADGMMDDSAAGGGVGNEGGPGSVGDCSCLLYTSPSPRDRTRSRMPSSA